MQQDAGVGDPDITDLTRRIANMIRAGTVVDVRLGGAVPRVKVAIGDPAVTDGQVTTAWLPYAAGRAAPGVTSFSAPEVGERVVVQSPGGDLRNGIVTPGGLNSSTHPAPADARPGLHRTTYGDGTVVEYDAAAHRLNIAVGSGEVHVTGTLRITGDVIVTGDVTAGTVSLRHHRHGQVRAGADQSGEPVA